MAVESTVKIPRSMANFLEYFQSQHSLEGMDEATWLRWGCIGLIWLLAAFWHQHQNEVFHQYIKETHARTPISDRLSQLAYNRALEILALFFILLLTVIFYDTRLFKAEVNQFAQRQTIAQLEQKLETASQPAVEPAVAEGMEVQLDALKAKYEKLFINYYYLKRCGAVTPTEFHLMNSALIQELTDLNAPAGIRKSILTAAKGSHDEMYADSSCEPAAIEPMQEQVRSYIDEVVQNLPDQ